MKRGGEEKWRPIIFDKDGNEMEDQPDFPPARIRIIAVRTLGYTHTEAGFRTAADISAEYFEYVEMMSHSKNDEIYS